MITPRPPLHGPILHGPPAPTLDEQLVTANRAGWWAAALPWLTLGVALGALACWHVADLLGWLR